MLHLSKKIKERVLSVKDLLHLILIQVKFIKYREASQTLYNNLQHNVLFLSMQSTTLL